VPGENPSYSFAQDRRQCDDCRFGKGMYPGGQTGFKIDVRPFGFIRYDS
jgi:hypothetical protein